MLTLRPDSATPLVNQIVEGLRALIETQALKHGAKLPSIRAFAASHAVSAFTVVEAYDRLVAQGLLTSRANMGFFVNRPAGGAAGTAEAAPAQPEFNTDWYLRQIFENRELAIKPGCGWLPHDWMFEEGVRRGMRQVAAGRLPLSGYGDPMGLPALRTLTAQNLATDQRIAAKPGQVLLAHGSSQALDLAVRALVKAGDVVLVDDPGYPNLMSILRFQGAVLVGVARTPDGYDMPALEALLARHRPVAFFTQPRLQSPTCSRASLPQLHQLLQLAAKHDFRLVENDIYADMDADHQPSLASLDQLQRVVYLGSYSKTISPNLRVGYMLAHPELASQLLSLKMRAGLTSSEVMERLVYGVITDGRWRKHLKSLRQRLAQAHGEVAQRLAAQGFELFNQPGEGMYLWARHPDIPDSAVIVNDAVKEGIMLGPGQLFLVEPRPTGWMRFNVAFSLDEALWDCLARLLERQRGEGLYKTGKIII
ncbi:PLP-dependent aminotransferase family protein [Orrella sp. JC864]|uniref:aminotransferase-like domain-containing protein n=1 Tax=Orrella sp. JC864 TaxID=3120298 RepID=UPI00300AEB91